jgi:transcriptional regulator with XRE-family HTH domain
MALVDRLREIRKELGSDAALARAAGVSRSAVSQWWSSKVMSLDAETALNIQENTEYFARWLVLERGPRKRTAKADIHDIASHSETPSLSDEHKLIAVVRIWLETDRLGREAIWNGAQVAEKRRVTRRSSGATNRHDAR